MFSILLKSLFCIVVLMMPAQARLLTQVEMQDFMSAHRDEIDAIHTRDGLHRGYCVVELAKQKMLNNEFSKEDKLKACSYYGNVILSALSGVGFGGLSKTNKIASTSEHRTAYLALYALGLNSAETPDASLFLVTGAREHKNHYQVCNTVMGLGYVIQNDEIRSSRAADILAAAVEKTRIDGKKSYNAAAFNVDGELYGKYLLRGARFESKKGMFSNYAKELDLAKKRKKAADDIYNNGSGKHDKFHRPDGFGGTNPNPKPTTPPSPPPPSSSTEPLEPWSGTLYRDLYAANEAIRRGATDDVCKSTGNLIVRVHGQSTYYSSTATVVMSQNGNVMAITNAHCVSPKEREIIASIELRIPGTESIFFNTVYIHPQYEKNSSDYDFAFLTGKHGKGRTFTHLLPSNITVDMQGYPGYLVSFAKVNYVENGRVKKLSDGERTLSIQRVESVGYAPLFKMTMPRYIQTQEPMPKIDSACLGALPIHFDPKSHKLDAAFSFGCSGSSFFVQVKERGVFLIGLLNSTQYSSGLHSTLRSNNISSIHAVREWVDQVYMARIKPTYTLR